MAHETNGIAHVVEASAAIGEFQAQDVSPSVDHACPGQRSPHGMGNASSVSVGRVDVAEPAALREARIAALRRD
ncbi:hypothetical protein RHIZ404_200942 [Rhizobium sp. EC-SD404]|nr:hypothetical protein RHIZ404_200942 [Rhizobium sp. EC-SD404]